MIANHGAQVIQRGHATARLDLGAAWPPGRLAAWPPGRLAAWAHSGRIPGAFRCLVCKVYVTRTAAGHCPCCGFIPPAFAPIVSQRRSESWLILIGLLVLLATVLALR